MPIVSYAQPLSDADGILRHPDVSRALSTWINPHAGLIAANAVPDPNAPTPLEQTIMDIHVLTGPKHSEAGQVTGTFLKATGPAAFSFQPHGLDAAAVGALPLAAQAADSDKLDGSHAAAFEPAIAAGSGDKYFAADKTFKFLDHLCASDGSPAPALSADAAGNITAVANLIFGAVASTLSSILGPGTQATLDPAGTIFNIARNDSNAKILRLWFGYSAYLTIQAPSANSASAHADLTTSAGHLKLAPATGFVGINNNAPAAALDVTGAIKASTTLTLPAMSSAGFVKNSAAGLLSGGNALTAADIPATLNPTAVKGATEGATPLEIRTASTTLTPFDISLLYFQDALPTTDASPNQTLLSIPIPQYSVCTVEALVTAIKTSDPTTGATYKLIATYSNPDGTATLIGLVSELYKAESDSDWNATLAVSWSAVNVVVTGKAATSISWTATATRHCAQGPTP